MEVSIGPYRDDGTQGEHIRVDDWDVFSADITLAKIIHPVLVRFKEETQSYPAEFEDMEQWHNLLDKMIFAFGEINRDWMDDYLYVDENSYYQYDWDGVKNQEIRIKEGLRLFAEYYLELWS